MVNSHGNSGGGGKGGMYSRERLQQLAKTLTWEWSLFEFQKEDICCWNIIWWKSNRKCIQRDRQIPHLIKCVQYSQKVYADVTWLKSLSSTIKMKFYNYLLIQYCLISWALLPLCNSVMDFTSLYNMLFMKCSKFCSR